MQRPNITKLEFNQYITDAPSLITAAVKRYVDQKRLSIEEADKYLEKATIMPILPVEVLAVRGYYQDSMGSKGVNDRGIYDDALAVNGPNYYKTFNGNTDPRIIKAGVGMLLPGVHYFKKGLHGFAHGPYKAFRTGNAREVLPVLRDGQFGIKDGFTVNLHRGGQYSTNSIACQTVIKDQWLEFQQDIYNLMDKEAQKLLPYILIETI